VSFSETNTIIQREAAKGTESATLRSCDTLESKSAGRSTIVTLDEALASEMGVLKCGLF